MHAALGKNYFSASRFSSAIRTPRTALPLLFDFIPIANIELAFFE